MCSFRRHWMTNTKWAQSILWSESKKKKDRKKINEHQMASIVDDERGSNDMMCIKIVAHRFEWQNITVRQYLISNSFAYTDTFHFILSKPTKKNTIIFKLSHKFIDRIRNESKDWIVVRLVWLDINLVRLYIKTWCMTVAGDKHHLLCFFCLVFFFCKRNSEFVLK